MQQTIVIGEVLKPQGIRGEIKVKALLDRTEDFKAFKRVYIGGTEYKVLSCRSDSAAAYLVLSGIADRNAAEFLRGKQVEGLRSDAPALDDEQYYIVDIIGCEVLSEDGEVLGEISDILSAHTDIYVLRKGEKEFMFPALKEVILSVDVEEKKMTVNKKRLGEVFVEQ